MFTALLDVDQAGLLTYPQISYLAKCRITQSKDVHNYWEYDPHKKMKIKESSFNLAGGFDTTMASIIPLYL